MTVVELRRALECDRQSCDCHRGKNTHCPAHADAKPSLSITEGRTAPLFKCFTGCDTKAILAALRERGLWPLADNVRPINARNAPDHIYRYMTAEGEVVGEKARWDSPKRFAWRMPGESAWSGGPQMDAMPLYNLADVLRNPGKPVFLVEGEKAVEACLNRGLVAVCLAGGAAQTRFGNALDPLADRDVILWPDNDDAGQALMGRVAAMLPDARWVKPVTAPKGDAYDYFANGGTAESLFTLMQVPTPSVSVVGYDAVNVAIPVFGGQVRFEFSQMVSSGTRTLDCVMRVFVEVTGQPRRSPPPQRINLYSASAIEGAQRTLKTLYPDKALDLGPVLLDAVGLAGDTWHGIDRSMSANDVPLIETRDWLVEGLIPLNTVTIPFGMGGSMKSLLMTHLAVCVYYGLPWLGLQPRAFSDTPGVLLVDYEDTPEEWRLRLHELCGALSLPVPETENFRWMPGAGIPLVDQAETVRALVNAHDIQLIVVDSALSAVGGDLLETTAIQRLVNFLTTLGVTSLVIAHNTKGGDTEYPYGSVFMHNLPRATIYIEAQGRSGDLVREVGLYPRKASRGAHSPLGARVTFGGDGHPLHVETMQYAPVSASEDETVGAKFMLMSALGGGAAPIAELVEATGLEAKTIDKTLRRNPSYFVKVGKRGRADLWALLETDREAVT